MSGAPEAPGVWRRLACMLYEGLLLFGVVMITGYLYSSLTQQRHALVGTAGLQAFMFVVIGIYFTWFWAQGRQTLAMKTWQLRVMTRDGQPLSQARAFARYVASWLWFLPGLAAAGLSGRHDGGAIALALALNVAVYALIARLTPTRQTLHDLLCGTRLERWRSSAPGQNPAT
ncbi:RDD family protein [Rubrivivax albus]|nr:RDD family protein [Rubrivivax albus]